MVQHKTSQLKTSRLPFDLVLGSYYYSLHMHSVKFSNAHLYTSTPGKAMPILQQHSQQQNKPTIRPKRSSTFRQKNGRLVPLTITLVLVHTIVWQQHPVTAFVTTTTTTTDFSQSCSSTTTILQYSSSDATTSTATTTAMPDITTMKAGDMRLELESYGISTKTLFDKRDFEAALLEARRDYKQTLQDCMSNSQAYEKKKKERQQQQQQQNNSASSSSSSASSSTNNKKKSYAYDRTNPSHFQEQERMWDMSSSANEHHHYHHARNNVGGSYRPDPDPVGPRRYGGGGGPYYDHPHAARDGSDFGSRGFGGTGVQTDPLFDHEAQYTHGPRRRRRQAEWGPHPPPPPPHGDFRNPDHDRSRRPSSSRHRQRHPEYNDPAVQMKYHQALEQSFGMKVEELQKELNARGISTQYCMVLADFCIQYAKAIAENKPKTDHVQLDEEDDSDHDYDPSYRDVVMEPYDPNKFF
jgi:hypothetical protein